ncbi:hypothetical protein PFJ02_18580 [Mycobacterium xenopi]|uniref:Uncharacterized protein n=1 Tax=Mycobacterium xenopi TaxID=1789 RepID=A0AAD1M198_MYCXE|nr:hypothetical protein [Mycobacterium xenopi]EUA35736.1 hypothetical protein I552_6538 [Mycobacterium xenopi 3993]EID15316.1 metal-dependent phosphohydrolase [Mycobacterium xenopi RIVM700367]MDA3641793.1 hypothetical protein [Mycobacterium xenopi]MDA3664016.1 hypothetical protein [Mycobacterium xenopi]ORX21066.1 hypothetical protein AWC32_02535 [Mycobacterium xenopi]
MAIRSIDIIADIAIPDIALARKINQFARDAEDYLLFDCSRRVFRLGAVRGRSPRTATTSQAWHPGLPPLQSAVRGTQRTVNTDIGQHFDPTFVRRFRRHHPRRRVARIA